MVTQEHFENLVKEEDAKNVSVNSTTKLMRRTRSDSRVNKILYVYNHLIHNQLI